MGLIPRILSKLLPFREIVDCEKQVYLRRWYLIRTSKFAVFIHQFIKSDFERGLHDHPWPFIVIPIWRGYVEHHERPCVICDYFAPERCQGCGGTGKMTAKHRVWPIIGTRSRPAIYRHRVELFYEVVNGDKRPLPSWSIFLRFKECREWGFWLPDGFMHWKK